MFFFKLIKPLFPHVVLFIGMCLGLYHHANKIVVQIRCLNIADNQDVQFCEMFTEKKGKVSVKSGTQLKQLLYCTKCFSYLITK